MNDLTPFEADITPIILALRFAADKHRNQKRKDDDGSPYINHLIEVLYILWNVGGVRDTATLTAAILHDTLEDTDTCREELRELFGEEVLSIVVEVTDDKSLPKPQRKQMQVDHAQQKTSKAKLVKLADKIANIFDISHFPPKDWSVERKKEYLDWSKAVVEKMRGTNARLEQYFDDLIQKSQETILARLNSLHEPQPQGH